MSKMDHNENINHFIKALKQLDNGERARFKRNAGQTLNESRDVIGLFYNKLLRNIQVKTWQEPLYFLIATLYPFEKPQRGSAQQADADSQEVDTADKKEEKKRHVSFGRSLRSIRNDKNGSGLDRRVERLLDSEGPQLFFYLSREVRFALGENGRIDWASLLNDLLQWERPDRYIQRNWARDYFIYEPERDPVSTPT